MWRITVSISLDASAHDGLIKEIENKDMEEFDGSCFKPIS